MTATIENEIENEIETEVENIPSDFQNTTFDYIYLPVSELQVVTSVDETGKSMVDHVLVKDEPVKDSSRFWVSLFARYGFNKAFFKYFNHSEVFERISERESNDRMRLCIERSTDVNGGQRSRLLAVSNPTKPIVSHADIMQLVTQYSGENITYSNGVVESMHRPNARYSPISIAADDHDHRFLMQASVDGYGAPSIYLALIRFVCKNQVVGSNKTFRSQISIGSKDDGVLTAMIRALDSFNNEEGYAALVNRIRSATNSWMSVYESQNLLNILYRMYANHMIETESADQSTNIWDYIKRRNGRSDSADVGSPILKAFHEMTGDVSESYGLANLDSLSSKRQRALPVKCRMYDAINFASEVATHHANPTGARLLQNWIGNSVINEYDLEGTCEKFTEFKDFMVSTKLEQGLTGSAA